jgi:hypothetical protein
MTAATRGDAPAIAARRSPSPGTRGSSGSPAGSAGRVLAAKLATLADLHLDFLVVVNPGCQRQPMTAIRRARLRTTAVHLARLVALARADSP